MNRKFPYLPFFLCLISSFFLSYIIYFLLDEILFPLDSDFYFHLSVAEEYSRLGFVSKIPWSIESIWIDGFGDTHFFYHQILRFFSLSSWKLFIAFGFFINLFSLAWIYFLLNLNSINNQSNTRQRNSIKVTSLKINTKNFIINMILIQFIFLFGSIPFTGRLLLGKGLLIFLPILFWYWYFLIVSSKKVVFLLTWIAVWTYPLAPLLLVLSFVKFIDILINQRDEIRIFIPIFYMTFLGFIMGLVIHPSFPFQWKAYKMEWWNQLLSNPELERISEWNPPGSELFFNTYIYIMMILVLYFYSHRSELKTFFNENLSLLFLMACGIFLSWGNTKAIEWSLPIFILFLMNSLDYHQNFFLVNWKQPFGITLGILFLLFQIQTLSQSIQLHSKLYAKKNLHLTALQVCNQQFNNVKKIWIRWDDFPEFSYYCRNKEYPFGLNPLYAYTKNSDRYKMIRRFWIDSKVEQNRILEYLNYEIVVLNQKRESDFVLRNFQSSPKWLLLYSNENYLLFQNSASIQK